MKRLPPSPPRIASVPDGISVDAKGMPRFDTFLAFMRSFRESLVSELRVRTPDNQVKSSLLLSSPDGTVYEIKVDDLGVVSAVAVTS